MGQITCREGRHGFLIISGKTVVKRVPDEATANKEVERLRETRRQVWQRRTGPREN